MYLSSIKTVYLNQIETQSIGNLDYNNDIHNKNNITAVFDKITPSSIRTPLLVKKIRNDLYTIIDGEESYFQAKKNNVENLPCLVIPEESSLTDTCIYYLSIKNISTFTVPEKVSLLYKFYERGLSKSLLTTKILPLLELGNHPQTLKHCFTFAILPQSIRQFCHSKQFSLKQCYRIASFSRELVMMVLNWYPTCHLTASLFLEFCSTLHDYLRAQSVTISTFEKSEPVQSILKGSYSPHERTRKLRHYIYECRHPRLIQSNKEIDILANSLNLPKSIDLKWDPTLEVKELIITLKVPHGNDLKNSLELISTPDVQTTIETIRQKL